MSSVHSTRRALGMGAIAGLFSLGLAMSEVKAADPVRIGLLSDQGGTFSALGGVGSCVAAKMAAADFGGTVLDRPIEILCADHQNKVEIASTLARNWLDTQGVTALADIASSAAALAVQQVATESNKAVVMTSASGTEVLVNASCSPVGALWAWNTRTQAVSTVKGAMQGGKNKKWFFITVDYTFGHALEQDATKAIEAAGGTVVGSVRHPLNISDFSSYLLMAQSSGADIVALATGGLDLVNAIKQADEFGLVEGGQKLASFISFITDIHSLGLQHAQGMVLTTGFYWDLNDQTRAWSARFEKERNAKPTMVQASVYSSVLHYLKGVKAAGGTEPKAVMAKMRELPINDVITKGGQLREDGLMLHDILVAEVKSPTESKGPWDYYKIIGTVPASEAYWPLSESRCPLVQAKRS
ncbi:ABC transporter substrate-binding protein [Azospirillum sp. YIM B02556]|uniref:ABC transporter substrate-binding protein n=1 Tax=Azospirillum endophyticum TaxID=2800326 RepID=A0ABS1EZE7_9PROT|nr:ABC transporter substrate-binding protein [Azospirillum endophyticum]MBK1836541.1 ABC transporter substrate-binding protein [Azospirillum endophyticum]